MTKKNPQRSRRTRRIIKKTSVNFGIFLKFSTTNHSRLNTEKYQETTNERNQIFRQIVMRQKNLATLQQIRRCFFTRKKKQKIKPIERARVCFPVRDYSQFLSCLPINGCGNPLPPSQYACLPALPRPCMNLPSLSYFWMRKQMIDEI